MTRILSSFAIIVAAAAIIAGGTYSFFQDSESVNGTFSAGDLNLALENPDGATPYTITDWAPGESRTFFLDVKNTGTVEMQIKSSDVVASGKWVRNDVDKYVKITDLKYYDNGGNLVTPSDPVKILAGERLRVKFTVTFEESGTDQSAFETDTYNGSVAIRATDVQ